jgi:hypothetical protein
VWRGHYTSVVGPVNILDDLSPYARVATALAPFLLAIILRLVVGKNRVTRLLLSLSTTWFAINILLTPYSARMQNDINSIRAMFR